MERFEKFLSMLSHELRNPLAAIASALHVLRARDGELGRETAVIERQTHHMIRLITDLLDVSRIAGGAVELRRGSTKLAFAVTLAVETASPQIAARGHAVTIDLDDDLLLDADPDRLAQVLSNILINAASYTPRGGRIEISSRRDGEHAVITIRDNGIGITTEQLSTIFEPFVQGRKSPDRAEGGLGIGLAIARSIVELHGGTIAARSDGVGSGTEMIIRWPTAVARLRVLVVEDSQEAADKFADMLKTLGHEAHIVLDVDAARAVIERADPQVALVHLGIRSIDCYELVQQLRSIPRATPTTFIGVSSIDEPADPDRSRSAGFARTVERPDDLASLRVALGESDGPAKG